MRLCALLVVTGLAVFASFPSGAAAQDKRDKLNGPWQLVAYTEDGKPMSPEEVKKVTLTIKGDDFTITLPEMTVGGKSKLDPSKKPMWTDTTLNDGRFKGKTLKGIYELKGDTYRACFAQPDMDRPREFSSKAGSGHILFVFKRAKTKS